MNYCVLVSLNYVMITIRKKLNSITNVTKVEYCSNQLELILTHLDAVLTTLESIMLSFWKTMPKTQKCWQW